MFFAEKCELVITSLKNVSLFLQMGDFDRI